MPSPKSKHRSSSNSLGHLSTGAAVRRGELQISDPIPVDQGVDGHPPSTAADINAMSATSWQQDATWPRKSTPPEIHHVRNASHGHQRNEVGRASAGPSLIPSSISTAPSKGSLAPKKSTGGFRSALKRMFGSKRGRSSIAESRKEFHRSDPGNLTSIMEKHANSRVIPVPTQAGGNVTRADALGSHRPTDPQNNLPRTSSDRNRLKSPRRRRRNTLPSLILTEQEAQILAGPKDDLALRSWREVEPMANRFKRRSRSADALNDMVTGHNLKDASPEDRQSQIAYWRNSVLVNPTPEYRGWPAVDDELQTSTTRQKDLTPIQTFDFGLDKPGTQPATIEERVNTLEIKVFDFEYAIARLQGNNIPKPLLHPKAPPKRRSIHELFSPDSEKSTLSSSPAHEPTSFLTSPDESPIPASEQEQQFRPDRTSKADTIRPLTARRRSPRRSPEPSPSTSSRLTTSPRLTTSQFDELMEIINQEQAARRQLEEQVADLQRELAALRTLVYAEIRPVSYPTPSPESVHETPVAPRTLHRSPRFYPQKTPQETSRFSMSDSIDTETDTDEGFQDVYETPQENRFTFETTRGSPLIGVN